ncbi:ATP-dependent DNA helicase RecG [Sulfurospirillum multivorans]|uniref:ATP-dependent DNA helicase RecG n=2 Tax=Sulfurospirillum multivorans TaxID=66821 RepID=A0AA86AKS8_SULMK|nr:ATP-dependent DNA helicase RecG [Sulfurospirillum multivorans]AHJ12354.1 ATP-dependent DNA helicase RecG [Sulfurospirillum multivorans DSM 12446]QEH05852.1 ATP-dependent DNA helicase RecG [Sulfurospirillum multivorans]
MKNLDLDPIDKERFKKIGVGTLLDLALLLPHSYENTTLSPSPLLEQINTLHVKVISLKQSPKVFQIVFDVEAWNAHLDGVIFAAKPYHKALFKVGNEFYIHGKVSYNNGRLQMVQPKIVTAINTLIPKYKTPLQNKTVIELITRFLTLEALLNEGLHVSEAQTLLSLHRPNAKEASAFSSFGYSESILNVLKFVEIHNYLKKLSGKKVTFPSCAKLDGNEAPFIASLPFTLTADQQKVIGEIKRDFLSDNAAKRVIMGDVGCGKTMIILASVMMCYPKKAILMAPTTVLANQLFEEAVKFLPLHVKTLLITQEADSKENLADFDFIIGTHALLYRELPTCALVMVDEQHRFGTKQRALLSALVSKQAWHPHYLQFSATPIPRTLSMIQSSLVDFSFIKMLPFPKDITTKVIAKKDFKALVEHLRSEIAQKHQCIIVYPLVEESEMVNYQSIDEGRGFWEKNFEGVFVTYGKDKNKEEILKTFKEEGNLLISTTVVEVGISLPNLSTIVIVGAERLGLASLHQLRGRVSRNGLKGYCFLYTNLAKSERLEKFSQTLDGFEIAELDLAYRQGGDVVEGSIQSGKKLIWFDIGSDEEILKEAKARMEL